MAKKEITKLYDCLLDNQDKPLDELILAIEKVIAELKPYDHSKESIKEACNVNPNQVDTSELSSDKIDKFSKVVETLEGMFSKRECIYMFVGMQQQMKEISKLEKFMGKLKGLLDQ